MEFILEVGVEKIGPIVQRLGDEIADGVTRCGWELLAERTPETGAGIVSFRKAGVDPVAVVAHLRKNGITAAARAGWIRTSPHFYLTSEDIEKMLKVLELL